MNARTWLVSVLMLVIVLFSACAPAATAVPPTTIPSTAVPPTVAPTQTGTMFSPKMFSLPMSLSFGSDWQVNYDVPGKFGIDHADFGIAFYIVTKAKLADPI